VTLADGRDRWAEWLTAGRDAPLDDLGRAQAKSFLAAIRDRVLRDAHLEDDARVLDAGAGTGLLALAACKRVGSGSVVALDLSRDALMEMDRLDDQDAATRAAYAVQGEVLRLPFGSQTFDAVLARSVLIYIEDKQAAASEVYRVLRPGGRVSIFEPINAAPRRYGQGDEEVPDDIRSQHEAVTETFQAQSEHWHSMMDFDERDLTHCFTAAGFSTVGLVYELLDITYTMPEEEARRSIAIRGNPTAPTWTEAARHALGPDADDYLHKLVQSRTTRPTRSLNAVAYISASR
jgi:SAM-dependent methyltransferase